MQLCEHNFAAASIIMSVATISDVERPRHKSESVSARAIIVGVATSSLKAWPVNQQWYHCLTACEPSTNV